MKITKNLEPLNKSVNEIRVLHSTKIDKKEYISKMLSEGKRVRIHKADGKTVTLTQE